MPPMRYVSSARARRAFVHDIVRYMAATISYARWIRDRYRDIVWSIWSLVDTPTRGLPSHGLDISRIVKAIFSEGFTETLCTGVYFQWMDTLKIQKQYSIFSEGFTNKCSTPLKYGIQFNVLHKLFTEIRFLMHWFQLTFHWKQNLEPNISVNGFTENKTFIWIFSEAIHWKQNFISYISVNHSLKIDISAQSFSEPFWPNYRSMVSM